MTQRLYCTSMYAHRKLRVARQVYSTLIVFISDTVARLTRHPHCNHFVNSFQNKIIITRVEVHHTLPSSGPIEDLKPSNTSIHLERFLQIGDRSWFMKSRKLICHLWK